jgi:hypothetical protein
MQTTAAPAASNAAPAAKTFWRAAARHRNVHTTIAFVAGSTLNIPLRKSGYLSEFRLNINGTVTPGAAATIADADAAINYLPFIGIKSAQGSYIHSYSLRDLVDYNYRLTGGGVSPLADPTYTGFAVGTATAQAVNLNVIMPVSINSGLNVETGLLLRQIPNAEFNLELRCALPADQTITQTAMTYALTICVEEIWFEAVGAGVIPPAFNTIVRLRKQSFGPMTAGGDYEIKYPVQPTILDSMLRVIENAVAAHVHVNTISLVANHQNQLESRRMQDIRAENYRHFAKGFRNGIFLLDFTDDGDGVNETRSRDFVNSAGAAELTFVVNTLSSFVATSSQTDMILRELVPLAVYR